MQQSSETTNGPGARFIAVNVYLVGPPGGGAHHSTLAGSSCEGATFQAAVLYINVRPDISTKGNLFEFI